MYDFDGAVNSTPGKLQTYIKTEQFISSVRPTEKKMVQDPTFKAPHKNNELNYSTTSYTIDRISQNPYKAIPCFNYGPIYTRPYYNIYETGWDKFRYTGLFES